MRRLRHREPHGEAGALALHAAHLERAAVGLDHLAGDRETQAGALDLQGAGQRRAEEALEEAVLLLARDADAAVLDGDLDELLAAGDPDLRGAPERRVLDRVRDQ